MLCLCLIQSHCGLLSAVPTQLHTAISPASDLANMWSVWSDCWSRGKLIMFSFGLSADPAQCVPSSVHQEHSHRLEKREEQHLLEAKCLYFGFTTMGNYIPSKTEPNSRPNVATGICGSKSHEHRINYNDVLMHAVLIMLSTEMLFIKTHIGTTSSTVLQDHTDLHPLLSEINYKPHYSGNTRRPNSPVSA